MSPRGKNKHWYFRVELDGAKYTHPTGTADLEEARAERDRFLKTIKTSVTTKATGHERVTVSELLDDYIDHLRSGGKKDAAGIAQVVNASLRRAFAGRLAVSITTQDSKNYRTQRTSAAGVQDSTVNKELKYLIAAYNHGKEQTPKKVIDTPYLAMESVSNVRRGFIEVPEYRRLLGFLPPSLKLFLVLAFHGANRFGEITGLKRAQVNRRLGVIELQQTKNGEDRHLPIYGDMAEWLDKQEEIQQAECPECEHVLFWHRDDIKPLHLKVEPGSKLGRFDKTWKRATKKGLFAVSGGLTGEIKFARHQIDDAGEVAERAIPARAGLRRLYQTVDAAGGDVWRFCGGRPSLS